ncbi:hypothetical protein K443DRAFT_659789, partial [Laccaria amethystina LaAM-08-1]
SPPTISLVYCLFLPSLLYGGVNWRTARRWDIGFGQYPCLMIKMYTFDWKLVGNSLFQSLPRTLSCSNQFRVYPMAAYQYTTLQSIFRSNTTHRPSLQHATPTRPSVSDTAASPSSSTLAQPAFKPPAYKHAHHLHLHPSAREDPNHVDH